MRIQARGVKRLVAFPVFVLCLSVAVFPLLGFSQASAEVLLQDDFENGARSEQIWTFKNPGDFGIIQDPAKARTGSGVLQMTYRPGTTGPGFEYASIAPSHDVYVRFYQKLSGNWVWSPIANKIFAIVPRSESDSAYIFWWAMWASGLLEANWQIGIDGKSVQNLRKNTQMSPGVWQCIEMRTKRSSAGQADGIHQLWIDDVMVMDQRNFDQGSQKTEPWTRVMLSAYHNEKGGQFTIPHVQYRWIDDLIVSTGRIGCLPDVADKTAPKAPSGVRIENQ